MSNTGSYASPQQYDELIRALMKFDQAMLEGAENMTKCGKMCELAMGSDEISANAIARLNEAVKKYRNVTLKSKELQKKLVRERDYVIELIRQSKMEGD